MEPITRQEIFLANASGESTQELKPITRLEHFLKNVADHVKNIGNGGGTGGGGAQPDWNANEGEAGHILNRTHWSEIAEVDIIPPCDVTPVLNEAMGLSFATLAPFELIEGNTYSIDFDSKLYTCVAKTGDTPYQYIGIGNAAFVGGEDTGEPFLIAHLPTLGMYCVLCADTNTHNVGVVGEKVVYHKIPDGYIPSDNYKVTFYTDPYGIISMANEWDDVMAAIESSKCIYGELAIGSTYSTGGSSRLIYRLNFGYVKIHNVEAQRDDVLFFWGLNSSGSIMNITVTRSFETGEITIETSGI